MSETFKNSENEPVIRKKPHVLEKNFKQNTNLLPANENPDLAEDYLENSLKQIKNSQKPPAQEEKKHKPNEPINSEPNWTDNLMDFASYLWLEAKNKALEVWAKIAGKEVADYYQKSYRKIESLKTAQNLSDIKKITSIEEPPTLKKIEGNDMLSKKLNKDMEMGLIFANRIIPSLKNNFSNNPEIQNFINNPESITPENWEKIKSLIDQNIIPDLISQNSDINFRYRTFAIQRLRIKASHLILEQIAKNAEEKVKKNEISEDDSDQLITHSRATLIQTQINTCEKHGIRLQNKIETIIKQRPNLSTIFKDNAKNEALNIYSGQIELIDIIELELRKKYILTSEELNFDPENTENMNIIRSNHSDLEDQEIAKITILLKQRKMALAQISNDQLMAEHIILITQAKLEGKNETDTAKIQDKLNYKYYQNEYDNLEKTYEGYLLLEENKNTELTIEDAINISYALAPGQSSNIEITSNAIENSGANITNLHIENNKIVGALNTEWNYQTSIEIPLNGEKLIINDPNAENGVRVAKLGNFDDIRNTILSVDFDHEIMDTAKNRGEITNVESKKLSKITDANLKALTEKLAPSINLLQNEIERRNFFTNLLNLLVSSDPDNEIRELDTMEEKIKVLASRLNLHTNRRLFIDYLKDQNPDDFKKLYAQDFTRFLNEQGLMETKRKA